MTVKIVANFENLSRRLARYVARVSRSHLYPTLSMAPSNYIFISFAHSDTIRHGTQDNRMRKLKDTIICFREVICFTFNAI